MTKVWMKCFEIARLKDFAPNIPGLLGLLKAPKTPAARCATRESCRRTPLWKFLPTGLNHVSTDNCTPEPNWYNRFTLAIGAMRDPFIMSQILWQRISQGALILIAQRKHCYPCHIQSNKKTCPANCPTLRANRKVLFAADLPRTRVQMAWSHD